MAPVPAVAALAYVIGSVPFSFWVARAFGVADVRRVGSGNVGATNVARSAGKGAGLVALLCDAGKGATAVAAAALVSPGQPEATAAAAVAAVVGHMYPVWLGFEGGKGVATGLGAFAPLVPAAALASLAAFLLAAGLSRTVSIGSVAGALALPAAAYALRGPGPVTWAAAATAALVLLRHRSNLRRILNERGPRGGGGE
ncbi:MAG: glycerol-3-phosphate 1-O-acyltransferase PlsY [Vicinamibacteria bacterium]